MKVLLTGATGFVGSHILDRLVACGIPAAVLVRNVRSQPYLEPHLAKIEVHEGALDNWGVLRRAMEGTTHVIHCAGCTKTWRAVDFFRANRDGTRTLVEVMNAQPGVQRLVHLSSLAAAGPARSAAPVRETDPPAPVSAYGESKLAGETVVRELSKTEFVILRPPAVYGPRDTDLLKLFQAVSRHLRPLFGGGKQQLSLVYALDLARVAVLCLTHPGIAGGTYNVAAPGTVTAAGLADQIARQLGVWTIPVWLPSALLWPVCLAQELNSRCTGKAHILSRLKYPELRAGAWICDTARLQGLGGLEMTGLEKGITETVAWYRAAGWLR